MDTSAFYRLAVCAATLALAVASEANAANAACADCAMVTINANLQVTKLHPTVTAIELRCPSPGAASLASSGKLAVVNGSYVGTVTFSFGMSAAHIVSQPNYHEYIYCSLWLESSLSPDMRLAVANAAQPLPITNTNWHVVAAGSTVYVVKELTFPNAAGP